MEAVGKTLGGVDIANGDREPARATALRGRAEGEDVTVVGDSHRRESTPSFSESSMECHERGSAEGGPPRRLRLV
jgi:hypothetical protein